ncbi:MAG: hypothetical protein ACJ8GN_02750, partial [Longimicrobiaceae bacterium]
FFHTTVPRDWPTLRQLRIPKQQTLPDVLTVEEVRTLVGAVRTLHNRTREPNAFDVCESTATSGV